MTTINILIRIIENMFFFSNEDESTTIQTGNIYKYWVTDEEQCKATDKYKKDNRSKQDKC